MRLLYTYIILFCLAPYLVAQERCASSQYADIQRIAGKYKPLSTPTDRSTFQRLSTVERIIPVVFHVVYRTADENLSDRQLASQVEVINHDFLATNVDTALIPSVFKPLIGTMGVRFALARTDPQGQPTSGIRRIPTSVPVFSVSMDDVKRSSSGGANPWPPSQYLNVWVCNVQAPFLGYSSFPGMDTLVDGLVLDYTVCGKVGDLAASFNQGRTFTHELGHFLNLYHIWGDEDNCTASDSVEDTPVQRVATFGCPQHPKASCTNAGDMFMNFMDYSDDRCLLMFTVGQRARALAALHAFRPTLGLQGWHLPPPSTGRNLLLENYSNQNRDACLHPEVSMTLFNAGTDTIHTFSILLQSATCSSEFVVQQVILPRSFAHALVMPSTVGCAPGELTLSLTSVNGFGYPGGFRFTVQGYAADTTALPPTIGWNVETTAEGWELVEYDTLDPLSWIVHNRSAMGQQGNSLALLMADAPYQTRSQRDAIFSPALRIASNKRYSILFDVALLALAATTSDSLKFYYSDNCGRTFTPFATLTTASLSKRRVSENGLRQNPTTGDWQRLEVPLPALDSGTVVRLAVEAINAGVSQLYLDNIFIGPQVSSLPPIRFSVFPNPASDILEIDVNRLVEESVDIRLYSVTGSLLGTWLGVSFNMQTLRTIITLPPSAKALQLLEIQTSGGNRTVLKIARD